MILEKIEENIIRHVIFVFVISGIADKRIRDPVGSDTSNISISVILYQNSFFHMTYENESSNLKYDFRKNRKKYNLICYFCV